jgi:hypothetical protein
MNTETLQTGTPLNVIIPDSTKISFVRKGQTEPETVEIYAMPLQQWKKGMAYIAQIAPMLGFDLTAIAEGVQQGDADAAPADDIDTGKLMAALQGEGSDLILEFMAFALEKFKEDGTPDVTFFNGIYAEVLDILAAIIEMNMVFFVQQLLPKLSANINRVVATTNAIKTGLAR